MHWLLIIVLFHCQVAWTYNPCDIPVTNGLSSLRVMTYNVRYETSSDGQNQWSLRQHNVFNLIRKRTPDVIGFQEVLRDQLYDLKDALPMYHHYGVGDRNGRGRGEFAPIFYRADRFDLLDNGTFWLSKTPWIPGSEGWDAAATRICSWVKLRDRRTYQIFYLFNTHFDSRGPISRVESARLIISQTKMIAGSSAPIILTGDFNASPTSDAYQTFITNTVFKDSKHLSATPHCGPESTFSTFFVGNQMGKCIDHIFVTGNDFHIIQHATLTDSNNGCYPSDHLPVMSEMIFKNVYLG